MRYLGMSLGMATWCWVGVLRSDLDSSRRSQRVRRLEFWGTHSGLVILGGIMVCLPGLCVIAGLTGISKEREMPEEQKKEAIKEFNLRKGIGIRQLSPAM